MEKQSRLFLLLGYFYIIIPIVIFLGGFCNRHTAIIGIFLIGVCSYLFLKDCPKLWIPQNKKEWLYLLIVLLIIILWVFYSGIGAFSYQNYDHSIRNPMFKWIISNNWPVIIDGEYILSYYIGFWLPSALIAKIFNSVTLGYYLQFIWAVMGVFLTLYYVIAIFKKNIILPVIIFIFFSGLDVIESAIIYAMGGYSPMENFELFPHIENAFPMLQFSSFTTQLYWVFNQAIPAWIITMFLYHQKDNRNIIFIYSCMFLCATLPAIGILPVVIYWCIKNGEDDLKQIFTKKHIIKTIKNVLSFQNLCGAFVITPISYFYLSNNLAGQYVAQETAGPQIIISLFVFFFICEAGVYFICIWPKYKKEPLLYIIFFSLLLYPFHTIGYSYDFCMRATIPALFILYLFVTSIFYDRRLANKKIYTIMLIIFLIIGSVTPLNEIGRSIYNTSKGITTIGDGLDIFDNFFGNNFDNQFVKYFMERH